MGQGMRQWKALMRKNFINWKRQPKCSFFEICCPAFVMFLMVLIRTVIDKEYFDYSSLAKVRAPAFPAFKWDNTPTDESPYGSWVNSDNIQEDADPFFRYASYPSEGYYQNFTDYELQNDPLGPLYFVPQDCLKKYSFQLPRQESPIIAVVGDENSQATYMMKSYLEKLIRWQRFHFYLIAPYLQELYGHKNTDYPEWEFKHFATKDDLYAWTSAHNYTYTDGNVGICYGFQMSQDEASKEWTLELYFNDQQQMGGPNSIGIPNTQNKAYNPLQTTPDTKGFVDYMSRGYSLLHNLAANIVLKIESEQPDATISLLAAPMPASSNVSDPFLQAITLVLPFLLLLIFIPPVYNTVFLLVKEKESRIKESMRMMGMLDKAYWLSWYVYYSMISTAIVVLAWCVLLINCIKYSNPFLVLVFMLFYGQAIFAEIIFLASLFENSKYSGIVGTLIYFGLNLTGIAVQQPTSPAAAKIFMSVIPQVAMQQLCGLFGNLEGSLIGLKFSNATETINNYTYVTGIVMLMVSFVVFTLLGFYMDAILPRTYGERKGCCFCFTLCCRGRRGNQHVDDNGSDQEALQDNENKGGTVFDPFEVKYLDRQNYEAVPPEVARLELENQFLKIQDLKKTYPNGKEAVTGINLKMYNGQIFALLGHNGAGKSTTISMLTGLLSKTNGSARIFDNDLFGQMSSVRRYMGVCPQHDVLFEYLTPEEHLDIFYDFKGGDPETKEEEIRGLIVDVGVAPDKKKQAGSLSGGNKRKLSVAIALCGNSRFVMLDEPTAGMDLSARRGLWDMLKNYKQNKIIILTTHYMDEADVLGDRIGIIGQGKLLCLGSSLFLKNRYGAGYKLTMVKKFKKPNKKIQAYLEGVFGRVEKLSEVSQEITFKIDYQQAAQFQNFFAEFDDKMNELDILSYGISMTTLEEVFIKVNGELEGQESNTNLAIAEGNTETNTNGPPTSRGLLNNKESTLANIEEETKGTKDGKRTPSIQESDLESMSAENLVGKGTLCGSIGALLAKRFNIYKRDKCGLVCELLVPVILVIMGLSLLQIAWLKNSPAFSLGTDAFPSKQRMLFNNENIVQTADQFTPQSLAENLPDYSSYWDITYNNEQGISYKDYYEDVDQQQHIGKPEPYRFGSYQIYKADKTDDKYNFQVNMFVNATSQQSVPYYAQYMYDSILTTVGQEKSKTIKLNTVTAPFPIFYVFESRVASAQALDFSSIVSIALALIPCVIISLIIKERENQLKHMQMVSGVSLPAYWISNLVADITKTYIPILIIILLQIVFDLQYDGVWQLIIIYPVAIVPFTYVTSFMFTSDTVAQIMTLFVHFMVGGILPIVLFVLQNIPSTADLGDSMRWWFTPFPTFCVGQGIVFSSTVSLLEISRNGLIAAGYDVKPLNGDIYAMANLSGNYTIMVCTGVVCTLLLIIIEADIFQMCSKFSFRKMPVRRNDLDMDDDVVAEEERLAKQVSFKGNDTQRMRGIDDKDTPLVDQESLDKSQSQMDVIRVHNFRKAYTSLFGQPFLAVERIGFGVDYGECFALLGVNGAGKTTTFKSLTRDIVPSSGNISIAGYNVLTQFSEARKLIGYCPQHNAIFDLMTVEEHLWFFARIKGVPANRRKQVVEDCIKQLRLEPHRKSPSGTLSGGWKRKLQVAVAIVGNPPIILLDEPSAGMDPEARRFMWSVVEKISQRDKKSAVILTTHSMEEAEALSTKMGIMVRGGIFRCFGSSQHIKNKFATGYELEIKIRKFTFQELEGFQRELGLQGQLNSRVDLNQAKARLLESGNIEDLIVEQIRKEGVGSDLFAEAGVNNGQVRMSALVQFCIVQRNGFKFIHELCQMFEHVELLEQCGDFYKLRTPREDKTIGFLFGHLESKKQEMNIAEYAVSQTSLEQIFQNFALQNVGDKADFTFQVNPLGQLILLNPDRKSTMVQKRRSIKGRQSEKSNPSDNHKEGGPTLI